MTDHNGEQVQVPRRQPVPGIKPPPPLITDSRMIVDYWKLFKHKWNNFAILTHLDGQLKEYKVAMLLHTLRDDALKICSGLKFNTREAERTVTEIMQAFDDFAIGEVSKTYERYLFTSRVQKDGETFDIFLSSLRQIVTTCSYCDNCVNSIIRDRIVLGVDNSDTQSTLLKESKLILERTITLSCS